MRHLKIISIIVLMAATMAGGVFMGCAKFEPEEGDLIFQQAPEQQASSTEQAIEQVTSSIEGYNFSHVGIVARNANGELCVLEATPPRVMLTPLDEYLYPEGKRKPHPVSVVARLKPEYSGLIPNALAEGRKLIGLDYDHVYRHDDNKYYCSELVYEIFSRANSGKELFRLNAMTFRSPQTGEIAEGWRQHFEEFGVVAPEGEPGTNPGAMSRSDVLEIVHCY